MGNGTGPTRQGGPRSSRGPISRKFRPKTHQFPVISMGGFTPYAPGGAGKTILNPFCKNNLRFTHHRASMSSISDLTPLKTIVHGVHNETIRWGVNCREILSKQPPVSPAISWEFNARLALWPREIPSPRRSSTRRTKNLLVLGPARRDNAGGVLRAAAADRLLKNLDDKVVQRFGFLLGPFT